jgi:aminoglycoside/choline kinase family phosphotransferase
MNELEKVSAGYKEFFGKSAINITALPESGSERKYFRIEDGEKSIIGVYNPVVEENEAFIGFTGHFALKQLPVPELIGFLPDKKIYFLRDLGDITLFRWLQQKAENSHFDKEAEDLYLKVLDRLILFQTKCLSGLNLDLCYPHRYFDRQSMLWDMNYFKYMFLKLMAAPFNEMKLEHDFEKLADFLLEVKQDYFLYRDFQSANIMIVGGEPWFIDYQGGRRGAPQYDAASLLFDAKACIPDEARKRLLDHYVNNFCLASGEKKDDFLYYFAGFSMIRLMQALGAFGFRGLYEKKPTFTGSIVPAVELLIQIIDTEQLPVSLPELFLTVRSIPGVKICGDLKKSRLTD